MRPLKKRIKRNAPRKQPEPALESKGIATFGGGENKVFGDPDAEDKGGKWGSQ